MKADILIIDLMDKLLLIFINILITSVLYLKSVSAGG